MRPWTMRIQPARLCVLMLCLGACCTVPVRTGRLSGRWVVVATAAAGPSAGTAAAPAKAQPLALREGSDCFPSSKLEEQFGKRCTETEAEAAGSSAMTSDDPSLDNVPTELEVRWFCDQRTVIRVVLARCSAPAGNEFRVNQIALSVEK